MTDSNKDAAAVAAEEYARTIEAKYHIVPPMALFGPIKNAFLAGAAWQAERDKAELERYKNDADRSLQLMALTMESQSAQLERMRAVVEAAKEMRDLLHLRLRYCPEALWLEENYIKLKDALAALERGPVATDDMSAERVAETGELGDERGVDDA